MFVRVGMAFLPNSALFASGGSKASACQLSMIDVNIRFLTELSLAC
jgi:hypothetical protein